MVDSSEYTILLMIFKFHCAFGFWTFSVDSLQSELSPRDTQGKRCSYELYLKDLKVPKNKFVMQSLFW